MKLESRASDALKRKNVLEELNGMLFAVAP
jgi:hypothetical protein